MKTTRTELLNVHDVMAFIQHPFAFQSRHFSMVGPALSISREFWPFQFDSIRGLSAFNELMDCMSERVCFASVP